MLTSSARPPCSATPRLAPSLPPENTVHLYTLAPRYWLACSVRSPSLPLPPAPLTPKREASLLNLLLVSVQMSPSHPGFPEQTFSSVSHPSFFPQKQLFPLLLLRLFMHRFLWAKKLGEGRVFTTVPSCCTQQSSINLVFMVLRQVDKVRPSY